MFAYTPAVFKRGEPVESRDRCGLCGKSKENVRKLVVGVHGAVCSDCIDLCIDIWGQEAGHYKLADGAQSAERESGTSWTLADLRLEVCLVNLELRRQGLVHAHSGNASGLDDESGTVLVKPSGVDYSSLAPGDLVAVDLASGEAAGGQLKPSVDLPHHLFLYRNMPEVRGIVHTHSNFATAFAACGRPIPCVLTSMADEFGGEIPCAPYVDNDGDNIGRAILEHRSERAPAILLANHGVFAWGGSPSAALKAAVMAEDAAKTAYLAMGIGDPVTLPAEEIEKWWDRYQNRYGQRRGD